ncbi:MAG: hypothetical protein ACR2MX_03305 [Cyclobacteriaceae bacterium]
MNLKNYLILNAILFIPFGLGMLFTPTFLFPLFGIDLNVDGLLMGRVVGSSLLTIGLVSYLIRMEQPHAIGMRAFLIGSLVFHAIDATTTFAASYSGGMNALGWMFSSMHFILAIGFLYFLYAKSPKTSEIPQEILK